MYQSAERPLAVDPDNNKHRCKQTNYQIVACSEEAVDMLGKFLDAVVP